MAREYRIIHPEPGFIQKVYNEQGVSWGQAKKALRHEYLMLAQELRQLREKDALVDLATAQEEEHLQELRFESKVS